MNAGATADPAITADDGGGSNGGAGVSVGGSVGVGGGVSVGATGSGGARRRRTGLILLLATAVGAITAAVALGFGFDVGSQRGIPAPAEREEPWTEGVGQDEVWAPLQLLSVVDPAEHGAIGDGRADDTAALQRAIDAVPAGGGILWLPPDRTYRTTDVLRITGDHVKVWSPNGQAEIRPSATIGERRHALIIDGATGVGLFGPIFRSDGDRRRTALEDSTVVLDGALETELVGLEITGSPSAAIFVFGASRDTWVIGNDLHDNWADGVHFTDGARRAWAWDNVIVNDGPTLGDDGIACVTYGGSARCGEMEWWGNAYLGGGWGRGLTVVGGDTIDVHHNLVIDSAAAGILVASEPSYDTPGSEAIRIVDNVVCGAGHVVPHPGILISGLDGVISDVVVVDNEVVGTVVGEPFRTEGDVIDLVEQGTSVTDGRRCQSVLPDPGQAARDTSILTTRDASFVPRSARRGLARIQVRSAAGGAFEQRLEYVVAGSPADLDHWLDGRPGAITRFGPQEGDPDEEAYVVVRTGSPRSVPDSLRPVDFGELRAMAGSLPELWADLDRGERR